MTVNYYKWLEYLRRRRVINFIPICVTFVWMLFLNFCILLLHYIYIAILLRVLKQIKYWWML